MNKTTILNAKETLEALDKHIKDYLKKLQDVEASIINVDKDIASGNDDCYHYRPRSIFHQKQSYKPYIRIPIKYETVSYESDRVIVLFGQIHISVPYNFCQADFDDFCNSLFDTSKKDMARCFEVKKEAIRKAEEHDKEEKRIRGEHKFQQYTYRWVNCPECNNMGTIMVGTGKYEDDPYSYSDSPGTREITKRIACPRCDGSRGLIILKEDGYAKEIPCGRWRFIEHESDLLKLLSTF